jgi:hypothetical protein
MPHMDEALFKYATKILHTHAANIRWTIFAHPTRCQLEMFFWWIRFWKNGCNTWLCTCMQTKTWYSWSFQWLQSRFPNFF